MTGHGCCTRARQSCDVATRIRTSPDLPYARLSLVLSTMGVKFENEKAQPVTFENRKCRDVFWLLLFIVFVGGMVRVAEL